MSSESLPWDDPILAPLLVLWLYLPAYLANTGAMLGGKWIPSILGIHSKPIDGGKILKDGHRLLGDGKTWNGLLGGILVGGFLGMLIHSIASGNHVSDAPFLDLLANYGTSESSMNTGWFWVGNEWISAFIIGCTLGLSCLIGDCLGSFIKRRRGQKREGDESSHAPLLDTLPFAITAFLFGQLLLSPSILGSSELLMGMMILLILTPIIHRLTNTFGYWVGLKDVPY